VEYREEGWRTSRRTAGESLEMYEENLGSED